MDKDFITENNFNEDIERFKELSEYKSPKQSLKNLYEYTFITSPQINEEGEEENNIEAETQDVPQSTEGENEIPSEPVINTNQETEEQTNVPQETQITDDGIETREMESDDEVIDVDDLTKSQEETEEKIDGVDERLAKLYDAVQKFSDQLDKNAEKINALKMELEKRNPTPEEKLNLRSQSSYPYNATIKGYWGKETATNPNYKVTYTNDNPDEENQKYEIKRSDIEGLDMRNISDTLNLKQDLKDYIGF